MTFRGHIHNGQVVLDEPAPLAEGVEVQISPLLGTGDSPALQAPSSQDKDSEPSIEGSFRQLVGEWKAATAFTSSGTEMLLHPAYQRIIGMGQEAVKLIVSELRREPDHWFWALKAITGEDPVAAEDHGKLDRMTTAWLKWAAQRGY